MIATRNSLRSHAVPLSSVKLLRFGVLVGPRPSVPQSLVPHAEEETATNGGGAACEATGATTSTQCRPIPDPQSLSPRGRIPRRGVIVSRLRGAGKDFLLLLPGRTQLLLLTSPSVPQSHSPCFLLPDGAAIALIGSPHAIGSSGALRLSPRKGEL
jgi:hypothetical protein